MKKQLSRKLGLIHCALGIFLSFFLTSRLVGVTCDELLKKYHKEEGVPKEAIGKILTSDEALRKVIVKDRLEVFAKLANDLKIDPDILGTEIKVGGWKYKILAVLGKGNYGTVYQVQNTKGKIFVIKEFSNSSDLALEVASLKRLCAEGR